jgi:arsenite methyltransferase
MSEINWESKESAEWYDQNCEHQFQKGQILIDMLNIKEGDSILDLGCGTGRQALHVSGIIGPSGRLIGIDPSSERIEIAKKKFEDCTSNNARFHSGQAEDLACIPDNSVDHAYFCSSFHWVDDKKTALFEVYRVLKPGGTIGMTTPNRDIPGGMRPILELVLKKYDIIISHENRPNIKRVSSSELQDLLSIAGFTETSIQQKDIPKNTLSADGFLKRFESGGRINSILKELPVDVRERIKQDIMTEVTMGSDPESLY